MLIDGFYATIWCRKFDDRPLQLELAPVVPQAFGTGPPMTGWSLQCLQRRSRVDPSAGEGTNVEIAQRRDKDDRRFLPGHGWSSHPTAR